MIKETQGSSAEFKPIGITIIGDSTVSTYHPRFIKAGWGQMLPHHFVDCVYFRNEAVGGMSSKSFIQDGSWKAALPYLPDYVLIQFGHNDCLGRGEKTTDPNSDFMDYIRKYVDDSREIDAKPILITPMARRIFGPDGKISAEELSGYAAAMKRVAQEKDVAAIDLHTKSVEFYNRLGEEATSFMTFSQTDRSHFTAEGAKTMAKLIAQDIPHVAPNLALYMTKVSE